MPLAFRRLTTVLTTVGGGVPRAQRSGPSAERAIHGVGRFAQGFGKDVAVGVGGRADLRVAEELRRGSVRLSCRPRHDN